MDLIGNNELTSSAALFLQVLFDYAQYNIGIAYISTNVSVLAYRCFASYIDLCQR